MKKSIIILISCIAAGIILILVLWGAKMRAPLTPSDPYATGLSSETPWWELRPNETPEADDEWVLDPEIPSNYIPVLGRNELYMVVDEDGNIIKYRQRERQEDGSWVWHDVNPDIPENYEPVPGLENVYKVTEADGSVHYYKYHRNDDDTYYFTEVDKNGNPIKQNNALTDDEIPANFVHVTGNIYAVYNEYGVLVGYKERVKNADGTYSWRDCDPPQQTGGNIIPDGGGIPGIADIVGGTSNVTVVQDSDVTQKGYTEEEKYTDTKQEGDWVIVYETIVTRKYDDQGNLVSTKKDGPTEINRIPATEVSSSIFNDKD